MTPVLFFGRLAVAALLVTVISSLAFGVGLRLAIWKHRRDVRKLGMWPLPAARLLGSLPARFAAHVMASDVSPICATCTQAMSVVSMRDGFCHPCAIHAELQLWHPDPHHESWISSHQNRPGSLD